MIYLDHNATTKVSSEVFDAMIPWLKGQWGNPSSSYRFGQIASKAIEHSREQVAQLCGATHHQVVFTSGATEANNTTLSSFSSKHFHNRQIVTTKAAHSSILGPCAYLANEHGVTVTYVNVDNHGYEDLDALELSISEKPSLASFLWANNETGVISPIETIAELCKKHETPLHIDAVQAIGKLPINFREIGADYLSLSGHKIGAPKGIGAMIIKDPSKLCPLIHGGKQENGLRGGTENVPYIVALGAAAELAYSTMENNRQSVKALRNPFEDQIIRLIPSAKINGGMSHRILNTSNIHIPGMDGDTAVTYLDQKGICISSGSACLEQAITPSHVILAMSGSHERASESIRVSFGKDNTAADVTALVEALAEFADLLL